MVAGGAGFGPATRPQGEERPNRGDPVTEIIARKIIELAQQGERDPVQLRERAIDFLSRQVGG